MRIKTLAAVTAGAAMLAMSAPQTTIAETLTVTSWGGSYSMSQRKALHEQGDFIVRSAGRGSGAV